MEGTEYVALFDFAASDPRQLAVSQGGTVYYVRRETDKWLRMRTVEGKVGGVSLCGGYNEWENCLNNARECVLLVCVT